MQIFWTTISVMFFNLKKPQKCYLFKDESFYLCKLLIKNTIICAISKVEKHEITYRSEKTNS
jgi:hypothetical protein